MIGRVGGCTIGGAISDAVKTKGDSHHYVALRLTGLPVEMIKLEAEINATDQLKFLNQSRETTSYAGTC